MAVKGELEGLISNHNTLITRGSIEEAAKIKEMIGGYLSKKDMKPRIYRAVRDKFEEFLYCAETNFERFKEIIDYEHLTQLEFHYPEFFEELGKELNQSARNMRQAGSQLYAGLLVASSIHADRKILAEVIEQFLEKSRYEDIERIFDRLEETRNMKLEMSGEDSLVKEYALISDEEVEKRVGEALYGAYSREAEKLDQLEEEYSAANAYRLGNILTAHFSGQELIKDAEMASTATMYLKEIIGRTNVDNVDRLLEFMQRFRKNPAIRRYAEDNPEIFKSYINSREVRDGLHELTRNLLGKTRFDDVNRLTAAFENFIDLQSVLRDYLANLKQNGFFVQAIDMAEKLKMREELTDDLKMEAFNKLVDEVRKTPTRSVMQRLRKFCAKHQIHSEHYPRIPGIVSDKIEGLEKHNPEIDHDMDKLYQTLRIERTRPSASSMPNFAKMFEPIFWFFGMIFKGFVKLAGVLFGGGKESGQGGKKSGGKGGGSGSSNKKAMAGSR